MEDLRGLPTLKAAAEGSLAPWWRWPAIFTIVGIAALAIDLPVSYWCRADMPPRELQKLVILCEIFGHGFGAVILVIGLAVLDPARRKFSVRVLTAALGSGLLANVLKLVVARTRPHGFDYSLTVWDTIHQWFPPLDAPANLRSFPSSHTATAIGLAIAFSWLYPRGRWLFACLTVMVALQRINGTAHYLSDTLFGAALGSLFAPLCLPGGMLAPLFERIERRKSDPRLPQVDSPPIDSLAA